MSEFKFNQNDEWYTPSYIIEAARKTFRGTINLDPASNSLANETVNANAYYTKECNGLEQPWFGNVWLNPPYSTQLIRQFTDKLINELYEVNLVSAIVLVNAKMETYYCQQLLNHCDAVCFTNHRIKFIDKNGTASTSPRAGNAIFYFGDNTNAFKENFSLKGIILDK